jgi:MFS family permease
MTLCSTTLAATLSATLASRLVGSLPHAQVLVVALLACAGSSGVLVFSHTALLFGLLRVALSLFDGGILTLAYGLGASVIPVAHQASAFGVLHSGAQIGSAVSPMLSGVLAAVSLRLAFLGNAALFCGGTVVAWHWLGARQADHHAAAPPRAEG